MSEHAFAYMLSRLRDAIDGVATAPTDGEREAWVALCHAYLSALDIIHTVETTDDR